MSDMLKDIKAFLVTNNIYTSSKIYLDSKPDSPEDVCCVFEYQGAPPDPAADFLERRVQVLTRALSYTAAKANAWAIFNLLDKSEDPEDIINLTSSRIAVISAIHQPYKLEEDNKKRTVFVCNYTVLTDRD